MPFWLVVLIAYAAGFVSGLLVHVPRLLQLGAALTAGSLATFFIQFLWRELTPGILSNLLSDRLQSHLPTWLLGQPPQEPPEPPTPPETEWHIQQLTNGSITTKFPPYTALDQDAAQPALHVLATAYQALGEWAESASGPRLGPSPLPESGTKRPTDLEAHAEGDSDVTGDL